MSDARYDTYQHYGTNAERLAFTPSPPTLTGVQPVYMWFETDTLTLWLYYTSWVQVTGALGSLIQTAIVTLTDAQIKALPTTPIQLVAAPAAGFQIKCLAATLSSDCSAGAYTNIDATYSAFYITHDTASNWPLIGVVDDVSVSLLKLTSLLGIIPSVVNLPTYLDTVDAGAVAGVLGWNTAPPIPTTQVDGKAINIYCDNNGSGNYTGGNAANMIKVTLYYIVEAL